MIEKMCNNNLTQDEEGREGLGKKMVICVSSTDASTISKSVSLRLIYATAVVSRCAQVLDGTLMRGR